MTKIHEPTDADLDVVGWAPGDYVFQCRQCGRSGIDTGEMAAKRVTICRSCAVKTWKAAKALPPPVVKATSLFEDEIALQTMREIVALFDNTFTQATLQRNARVQVLVLGAMHKARR